MSISFEKKFQVGWGNCDFNGHMGNTSFLDFAADTRLAFFAGQGFPTSEFQRLQFGPVVRSDFIEYFRELRLLENFKVTLRVSGLSPDASRFRFVNCFYEENGKLSAKVTSLAGWLDLNKRKLIAPPEKLREAVGLLERTTDFEVFESSLKTNL